MIEEGRRKSFGENTGFMGSAPGADPCLIQNFRKRTYFDSFAH